MKDGFLIFYNKDGVAYPVAVTEEQNSVIQLFITNALDGNVKLINKPVGTVVDIRDLEAKR